MDFRYLRRKIRTMNYKAFLKLSYGIYIIASEFEGKKAGYIGNTAFQVTSDPPRIAISCHKKNDTSDIILKKIGRAHV